MNQELDANLQVAIDVAREISSVVPWSSNPKEAGRVRIDGPSVTHRGQLKKQILYYNGVSQSVLDIQRKEIQKASIWEDAFENADRVCRVSGVGNCGELAAMACKSFRNRGVRCIDYVSVDDNKTKNKLIPHIIAVIGRQGTEVTPNTIGKTVKTIYIGLPNTWGSSAVICDPWIRAAYPAKDFEFYWEAIRSSSLSPHTLSCYLLYRFPN